MQIVILAGGKATRLQKHFPNTIKSLLKFDGISFIEYQLSLLKRNGLVDIVLCLGHGAKEIHNVVKNTHIKGLNVQVSYEGHSPIGTAFAIRNAWKYLNGDFLVIYGDSYLDFNYYEVINKFRSSRKKMLTTIYHNKGKHDKSNILFEHGEIISYNKVNSHPGAEHIDYGANIFKRGLFINPISSDLSDLQRKLIGTRDVACEVIKNRFYEVGSVEGIQEFKEFVKNNDVSRNILF
jgi:NDP-sugar pyrophosphorylase family protein